MKFEMDLPVLCPFYFLSFSICSHFIPYSITGTPLSPKYTGTPLRNEYCRAAQISAASKASSGRQIKGLLSRTASANSARSVRNVASKRVNASGTDRVRIPRWSRISTFDLVQMMECPLVPPKRVVSSVTISVREGERDCSAYLARFSSPSACTWQQKLRGSQEAALVSYPVPRQGSPPQY